MFCPAHQAGGGVEDTRDPAPAAAAGAGASPPVAAPVLEPEPRPEWHTAPVPDIGWAADPRLEPLPMALRPGWTEEPLQRRRSGTIDTLGLVALILAGVGLPFSACCGFGGIVSGPLGLVGLGLGIAALIQAPKANNPTTVRWLSGFAIAISLLILAFTACFLALTFGGMSRSLFSVVTP
jgi:hypothetical protein